MEPKMATISVESPEQQATVTVLVPVDSLDGSIALFLLPIMDVFKKAGAETVNISLNVPSDGIV